MQQDRLHSDSLGNLVDSDGITELTRFRYAGQYLDHTGLYKMGKRYYDPTAGRWTQQDRIYNPLDSGQWNRYAYVGADPVNFVDPSGLILAPWNWDWGRIGHCVWEGAKATWTGATSFLGVSELFQGLSGKALVHEIGERVVKIASARVRAVIGAIEILTGIGALYLSGREKDARGEGFC